jgi:hypothetical protein
MHQTRRPQRASSSAPSFPKPNAWRLSPSTNPASPRSLSNASATPACSKASARNRADIFAYDLVVTIGPSGAQSRARDPYSFLPSVGETDLFLFAQGNERRIYDKLGAHLRTFDGVAGTSFAVWAPNAQRVSVVGDFNGWDGRRHLLRRSAPPGSGRSSFPAWAKERSTSSRSATSTAPSSSRPIRMAPFSSPPRRTPRSSGTPAEVRMDRRSPGWRRADTPTCLTAADVGLRGPPRFVAQEVAAESPGYRELAGPLIDYLREIGLHPRRVPARQRARVLPELGLPGDRLLLPHLPLRHPRRLPIPRQRPARRRHRGAHRLGARTLPARRLGPRPLRRHLPLRARGSRGAAPTWIGEP